MIFRLRVGLIHLAISSLIALLIVTLVFGVWYPSPLHVAVGVTKIFLLVLVVDISVGPLLSFVVSKPGKKSLRFDLTVIGICQVIALSYGLWVVAEGRPVWLVFNVDRVDLVQAYELDTPYTQAASEKYQKLSWTGPQWVATRIPEDVEARNTLTFDALLAGVDLPQRPDLYVPFEEERGVIQTKARELEQLKQFNEAELVEKILLRWPEANAYLPMMAPAQELTVLIEKESARVIALVELKPWE
jgi:hypothetical protein